MSMGPISHCFNVIPQLATSLDWTLNYRTGSSNAGFAAIQVPEPSSLPLGALFLSLLMRKIPE